MQKYVKNDVKNAKKKHVKNENDDVKNDVKNVKK